MFFVAELNDRMRDREDIELRERAKKEKGKNEWKKKKKIIRKKVDETKMRE